MTLEKLKERVRQFVGKSRIMEAIKEITKWARDNNKEQLKIDIALLEGGLNDLQRKQRLGLLSNAEASTKQNNISYGVLSILNGVDKVGASPDSSSDAIGNTSVDTPSTSDKLKILMLTANPAKTTKLNLDKEHSFITQKLQGKQDAFIMLLKKAVSGTEFKEFTQQEQPDILHFSGHGEGGKYAGIIVQNDDKNGEALIPIGGLKALFKFFKKKFNIKVVLLNACHTQEQAATIAQYVEYVIGTNVAIGDTLASAFSSGFYFQLAENSHLNIEDAFDSGRTEAVMKGADEENFVIYKNGALIEIS